MFIIYKQTINPDSKNVWDKTLIQVVELCDSEPIVKQKMLKHAQDFIHSQTDNGYEMNTQSGSDIIIITKKIITTTPGTFWGNHVNLKCEECATFRYTGMISNQQNEKHTKTNLKNITCGENKKVVDEVMKELILKLANKSKLNAIDKEHLRNK